MNRAYKLVWNNVFRRWIVASEMAKSGKKSSGNTVRLMVLITAGLTAGTALAVPAVNALPAGEIVTFGKATFDRSIGNQLTVNQSTSKLITNWNSFNVGANSKVVFTQPDASSIALNRVTSVNPSEIFGQVSANGQLVIVNPSGITFGAGSSVNAAGLIASALDITNSNFSNGNLDFALPNWFYYGAVENNGSLTASAGSVSLLGPLLKNSGSITANGGNANLINTTAVNLTGPYPSIPPDMPSIWSKVQQIQQSGSITATRLNSVGGRILLLGDTSKDTSKVTLTGTLNADETTVTGYQINISGALDVNGTHHQLNLNGALPYTLDTGSKINLNGSASGFAVNGNAYTVIRNILQLQDVNTNPAGNYVLARDVNASATSTWNNGAGFRPIGSDGIAFSGLLDGLGHSVNSLVINTPSVNKVGLIGLSTGAGIRNFGLKQANIRGLSAVGGLIGQNIGSASSISNSYVTGSVSGTGNSIGGLVGFNQDASSISNSNATASVSGSYYVGGLVGSNSNATITNSYAGGKVSGSGYVGGLIGSNSNATITNSYATGKVSAGSYVGGLIGSNSNATITNSYATGKVSAGSYVGGLVGSNSNATITNSYATGRVDAISQDSGTRSYGGGLIGANVNATVNNSYATGNVNGSGDYVGGLIGSNTHATVNKSHATGRVISSDNYVGGLIGSNANATIDNSYATGNVLGGFYPAGGIGQFTGGLIGSNDSSAISQSYATGNVVGRDSTGGLIGDNRNAVISQSYATGTVSGERSIGGLVGSNYEGTISQSHATGRVKSTWSDTGGLVGFNSNATISNSYASGNVYATGAFVGGLLGTNYDSTLDQSYASGNVSGKSFVGGLVGGNGSAIIRNSYASGTVRSSDSNPGFTMGGLVGLNSGNSVISTSYASGRVTGNSVVGGIAGSNENSFINNSYWQDYTNGRVGAVGNNTGGILTAVKGLSSDQMKQSASFANWNIASNADYYNVWRIYEGQTAPLLRAFLKPLNVSIQNADASRAYDGTTTNVDLSYTLADVKADASKVFSHLALRNAGSYKYSSGLYSGQDGYDLSFVDDGTYSITPKALTISTLANSKVYDGGVTSANKPSVTGLVSGDRITGLYQQYDTKTVGTGKKLLIKAGYVVQDGNGGNNYSVTEQGSNDGVITAN